jgi:hypothetical protein
MPRTDHSGGAIASKMIVVVNGAELGGRLA